MKLPHSAAIALWVNDSDSALIRIPQAKAAVVVNKEFELGELEPGIFMRIHARSPKRNAELAFRLGLGLFGNPATSPTRWGWLLGRIAAKSQPAPA